MAFDGSCQPFRHLARPHTGMPKAWLARVTSSVTESFSSKQIVTLVPLSDVTETSMALSQLLRPLDLHPEASEDASRTLDLRAQSATRRFLSIYSYVVLYIYRTIGMSKTVRGTRTMAMKMARTSVFCTRVLPGAWPAHVDVYIWCITYTQRLFYTCIYV